MSARREVSSPPVIPGYEHVRLLGMGGFADVFLYRQLMPRRPVAVKVLLAASLDDAARVRFRAEADIMASLSHHPSIVTVYQADVAADGRPYLIMEYCSRPGLAQRYRAERMSVAEVLRIGVRLASAVETAHRAGILHRDIKPANVLVTDFGWPALTDFGIAATAGLATGAMVGMSIPWSPPEMLTDEPAGDVRSDVYSLAATVYSLLARRSPFEVLDAPNSAADLMSRIERSPLAPTGRGDVPESLQAVLDRAMAKEPDRRYHSALALARALQQVEAELMLPLTPLDLPEDVPTTPVAPVAEPGSEADQATRLRPVRTVSPEAEQQLAASAGAAVATETVPAAGLHLPEAVEEVPESWLRHVAELEAARSAPQPQRRRVGRVVAAGVAGAALVTALVIAATTAFDSRPPLVTPSATGTPTDIDVVDPLVAPTDLIGTVGTDGAVTFRWTNPQPLDGDQYLWGVTSVSDPGTTTLIDRTQVTFVPDHTGEICVRVALVREDRRQSDYVTACVQR